MSRFTCRKGAAVAAAAAILATAVVSANPAGAAQAADIPTVSKVSESTLSLGGGDIVSITGSGFVDSAEPKVYFDSNDVSNDVQATNVIVVSDTRLIAEVPDLNGADNADPADDKLKAGSHDVVVENTVGHNLDTLADDVTFVGGVATDFKVKNATGLLDATFGTPAGGDTLTLIGTDLQKATKVTFDGVPATITKRSTQGAAGARKDRLTVKTPAHAATADPVDVVVYTPKAKLGITSSDVYSYAAPITGASVTAAKTTVQSVVSLKGLSLNKVPATDGLALVHSGGAVVAITDYIVVSDAEIVAVVPTGLPTGIYKWTTDVDGTDTDVVNGVTHGNPIESAVTFAVTA